jgi:hypothetical protein
MNGSTISDDELFLWFHDYSNQFHNEHGISSPYTDATALQSLFTIRQCQSVLVCSILGSYLAQEVIKAVSLSGEPGFNIFEYVSDTFSVRAFPVT